MVTKELLNRFSDQRGFVVEPLDGELLALQKNAHVVVSRPGAVRGNHYHLKGTETLIVCGPARVLIRKGSDTDAFIILANQTYRLIIPPGISHAVQNTGETDGLLIAFNTEPHDPDNSDLVPDVLIPI